MTEDLAEDYFDATPVPDGIGVRMSDNVARTLAHRVEQLAVFLETGQLPEGPRGFFARKPTAEAVIREMYPDSYADPRAAADFRARHSLVLNNTIPARSFISRCASGTHHVLSYPEAEDWVGTLGLVRFLTAKRFGRRSDETDLIWFTWAQEAVVAALHPDWTG